MRVSMRSTAISISQAYRRCLRRSADDTEDELTSAVRKPAHFLVEAEAISVLLICHCSDSGLGWVELIRSIHCQVRLQ